MISVVMNPGRTALKRTPSVPYSSAALRTTCSSAPFPAVYPVK